MSLGDTLAGIFGGGGGGGGGGYDALLAYQDWFREEAARIDELDAEERVRATQVAGARRNEILDRPGYSGSVLVGSAARRSDATLAAEMAALGEDDEQRIGYEAALAAESDRNVETRRLVSGEQYRAESDFEALRGRLEDIGEPGALSPEADEARASLKELLADLREFGGNYDWFSDDSGLADDIQERIESLNAEAERERRRRAEAEFYAEQNRNAGL